MHSSYMYINVLGENEIPSLPASVTDLFLKYTSLHNMVCLRLILIYCWFDSYISNRLSILLRTCKFTRTMRLTFTLSGHTFCGVTFHKNANFTM